MGLTFPEAMKRVTNNVVRGIAKSVVTQDELAAVIPLVPTDKIHYPYRREGTLPDSEFIDDSGVTTEESSGTDDNVMVPLRRIVGNVDVDNLANDLSGDNPGEQFAAQIAKKIKTTWRLVQNKLVNGLHTDGHAFVGATPFGTAITAVAYGPWLDSSRYGAARLKYTHTGTLWAFQAPGDVDYGTAVAAAADGTYTLKSWNPNKYITLTLDVSGITADDERIMTFSSTNKEFEGLIKLCAPDMVLPVVGTDGDTFDLGMLDKLISIEQVNTNRAFLTNAAIIEKFYAAYRALGGTDPQHVSLPGYGRQVPTYRGYPLLRNDWVLSNETVGSTNTCSSVYLASLDEQEGLSLAVANAGGQVVTPDADPRTRPVLGFRIENLGPLEQKDASRARVKFYGAPILRSSLALARRPGIKTA